MNIRSIKFGAPFSIFILGYFAFSNHGWIIASPLLYSFVFIPIVELLIKPKQENMSDAEEQVAKSDRLYDIWLYLMVPFQYATLFYFMISLQDQSLSTIEYVGRIAVMGLLCGTFGINVGHELGHRRNLYERNMAKALLLTSLYMHFYIEHNKGHHKNVSTAEDPSSARRGEPIYLFYFRTVIMGFLSAWKIAGEDQLKKGKPILHFSNQMIQFQLLQIALLVVVYLVFGLKIMMAFMQYFQI